MSDQESNHLKNIFKNSNIINQNLQRLQPLQPQITASSFLDKLQKEVDEMNRSKFRKEQEQIAREEKANALLEAIFQKMNDTKGDNITFSRAEIVNVLNGPVENLQQNTGGSTGTQNIFKEQGIRPEQFAELILGLKQIFDLLPDQERQEAREVLEEFQDELIKDEQKPSVLLGLGTILWLKMQDALNNPIKTVTNIDVLLTKAQNIKNTLQAISPGLKKFFDIQ